jgi:hypothetical protein
MANPGRTIRIFPISSLLPFTVTIAHKQDWLQGKKYKTLRPLIPNPADKVAVTDEH